MPAKDKIHDSVKNALVNAEWTVTDGPLTLTYEDAQVFIDLGAERLIAAERGSEKIAVEIKSFIGRSTIRDIEIALGQYVLYRSFLRRLEPERKLYIGLSHLAYNSYFKKSPALQMLMEDNQVSLLVINTIGENIELWVQN